jgi:hypothetical protein
MNRYWAAAPLAVAALMLTGCSGLTSDAAVPQPDVGAPLVENFEGTADSAGSPGTQRSNMSTAPGNTSPGTPAAEREVIRKATVTMLVDDPDTALVTLQGSVLAADGYVQSVATGTSQSPCSDGMSCRRAGETTVTGAVTVVLRIPAADYDAVMDQVQGLGEVAGLDIAADDVTGEVTDLDARINAQRESVARVSQLMKQASNLSEVVRVEQELATRQSELESLVAQRQQLRQSVALATITAVLVPPAQAGQLVPVTPNWWEAPWDAFVSSWRGLLVALAALSPLLILGAATAVAVMAFLRHRRQTRPDAVATETEVTGEPADTTAN